VTMKRPKVLLVVDDGELRARYELVLRFSGYEPIAVDGSASTEQIPHGVVAACILADRPSVDGTCANLLAQAAPVFRIDPFTRHPREHLPFDVVLPATSEPRALIAALRHLRPGGPPLA